jgi:hypothetical protein
LIGDASEFRSWLENKHGIAGMGQELKYTPDTLLHVQNPEHATARIIHNGNLVQEKTGIKLKFQISDPGIYRVEVYKSGKAWIFSNHIRLVQTD